jgi:inner membrane protein
MAFEPSTSSSISRAARSPALKLLVIVCLTIAMAVPLFLVSLVASDRQKTAAGAAADIAQGYGGTQLVAGPVLLLPYTAQRTEIVDGKQVQSTQRFTAVILPDDLKYKVRADAQTLSRGIFPVPVYRASIGMRAAFDKAALELPADAQVIWKDAAVAVLVSDARGLADNVSLNVNGRDIAFEPGQGMTGPTGGSSAYAHIASIQAKLDLAGPADLKLNTNFVLRGSREFSIAPLGRRTVATVDSSWASPSFFGAFLPAERRIGKNGFEASWTVPYLARGFGQVFMTPSEAVEAIVSQPFGARFYQPVDQYQLVERALKYAVLFVALAFLVFFVVETVSQRRIHFIQYAMVGVAQVLFYLLLLSIAEHTGFRAAYAIAAAATIILTSLYAIAALSSRARAAVIAVILSALYGLLYLILNSEDNALLTGSCVLFAALAGTMYFTRRIDWYRMTEQTSS